MSIRNPKFKKSLCCVIQLLLLAVGPTLTSSCRKAGDPPYSPEEALKTFRLPEGFRIELVASEPEIVDPIAFSFDDLGRLYVVEMRDYPLSDKPLSRIKLLEDRNGDGRFDHSTIFVDGLHFPHGVMPWKEGIIVTCAPDILYFADTQGDGRADVREVLVTGFARVNPQLRVNAPNYGIDNWIYVAYPRFGAGRRFKQFSDMGGPIRFADHPDIPAADPFSRGMDLRFNPDRLKLEAISGNSQFGLAFNDRGHRFVSWNNRHIRHVVIENRYLERNPYLAVDTPMHSPSDHGDAAPVYPLTDPSQIEFHGDEVGRFTSACGQSVYTGGNFPAPYENAYFVSEPVHNIVHCDILKPRGATFVAGAALERAEFLASSDTWFKPVFTAVGPDGALYIADFYRASVEHPEFIRQDLAGDYGFFSEGDDRGRIYRIVHESSRPTPKPGLREAPSGELVKELENPNRWWRITAQRLLVERQDHSVVGALQEVVSQGLSEQARLHSLWTLEGLGVLSADTVLKALYDESPAVLEQALVLAESYLSDPHIRRRLLQIADHPDERVRFQLACTLGELSLEESLPVLRQIALRHLEDSWFQIAVLTGAAETAGRWFRMVRADEGFVKAPSAHQEAFLRRITSIIGARQRVDEVTEVLTVVHESRLEEPDGWQVASLEGLAQGLKLGPLSQIGLPYGARQTLVSLLEASSLRMAAAAIEIAEAVTLPDSEQLRASLARAGRIAADSRAGVEARVNAIRMLGFDRTHEVLPLLVELLAPQEPEQVQAAAVLALLAHPEADTTELLLEKWEIYTPALRELVLGGFFREPDRLPSLVEALEENRILPSSLTPSRRRQLAQFPDESIGRRAERVFADRFRDRQSVVAEYMPATGVAGDAAAGMEIFRERCSQCHRVGDLGFEVGPDLAGLANRSRAELLEYVLDPNSSIAPGYEDYVLETRDGRIITGIMAQQSATAVTLRRSGGEQDTVLRSNIAGLRSSAISAMPEELEYGMSLKEMADLLEYLKSLAGSP